jgi:hypothetical protein
MGWSLSHGTPLVPGRVETSLSLLGPKTFSWNGTIRYMQIELDYVLYSGIESNKLPWINCRYHSLVLELTQVGRGQALGLEGDNWWLVPFSTVQDFLGSCRAHCPVCQVLALQMRFCELQATLVKKKKKSTSQWGDVVCC